MNKPFRPSLRSLICSRFWLALLLLASVCGARAQDVDRASLMRQVQDFANGASSASAGLGRIQISVGTLDPRLKLAPCAKAEPYLPNGTRLWGKANIGVRCVNGAVPWNVYVPVTVRVFNHALVATNALAPGSTLTANDFVDAEIDIAAESGSIFLPSQGASLIGRTVLRAVLPGQGLRNTSLKIRQWFAAGDTVRITAVGSGFSVEGSGEALSAGIEGQTARVRTDGGRIVSGMPVRDREVELSL